MLSAGKKEVITYLFEPGKKFYHIAVKLKNEPGAMANVATAIARGRINVLSGFTSVESGGQYGNLGVFAEDSTLVPTEIEKLVSSSPYAVGVVVKESVEGFMGDSLHFPITASNGKRVILIRQGTFSRMLGKIRETFGSGGETIQYLEGYETGKALGEELSRVLPAHFEDKHLDQILSIYSAVGWARAELVSYDVLTHNAVVRLHDNLECAGQKSTQPYSHFVRGHLCGMLTSTFQTDLRCEEKRCVAAGDGYCEYAVSSVSIPSAVA